MIPVHNKTDQSHIYHFLGRASGAQFIIQFTRTKKKPADELKPSQLSSASWPSRQRVHQDY